MTKINHEEYRILKSLDDDWEWIARDYKGRVGGNLFAYSEKPYKDYHKKDWGDGSVKWLSIGNHHFQYIQWQDEEPYNIAELIEEYEDKSEVLAQRYGYKLEKEQKYFAKIKGHENISSDDKYWNYCITDESLDIGDNKVHADVLAEYVLSATKDRWANLGINDDNADFVEVEEMEE